MLIAITNHGGARNRGCDALVEGILAGLATQKAFSEARVVLHTGDYAYDSWRYGDRMSAIKAYILTGAGHHLPWPLVNKAIYKLLAVAEEYLPERYAAFRDLSGARDADLVISTGGDVFSSDYGNFRGHASYLMMGAPVFMCAHSIGPFSKADERYFRASMKNVRLFTARESHSANYLKELKLPCRVEQTADVAFLLPVLEREATFDYVRKFQNADLRGRKLIGLSISELVTKYNKKGREAGLAEIARFIDALNDRGYGVILIPHVVERKFTNDDQKACLDVLRKVKALDANVLMGGWFTSVEAKSVIGLCDALLGARTHTTIASLSQGIPTVSIAYSRKAYGIMEDYYGPALGKKLTLSSEQFSAEGMMDALDAALAAGRQDETAARMKKLALKNFELLAEAMKKK